MRPNAKDRDRAGDQHLAREDALALPYAGDIGHRFDLVLTGPAMWREERVQPVSIGAGIGVRHDLTALLVVGCVGNPPPDLLRFSCDLRKCESAVGWSWVGYHGRLLADLERKDMVFAVAIYLDRRCQPEPDFSIRTE